MKKRAFNPYLPLCLCRKGKWKLDLPDFSLLKGEM